VALPLVAMLRETVIYLSQHLRLEPWPVATAGRPAGLLHGAPSPPCRAGGEQASPEDRYCGKCGAALRGEPPADSPMSGTQNPAKSPDGYMARGSR
jgi:hypothetical protein